MSYTSRQNTLFVAEDWKVMYDQLSAVDFTALDFQSLRESIYSNIRATYPESFNDWIGSSEFIIKMDTLMYLAQVLAYRFDLNARETFSSTAERRDSILKLAYNLAYSVSRVRGASGLVKIKSIRTSQTVYDLDDNPIRGDVLWNDTTDPDWYDKWLIVLNAALDVRSKWGRPVRKYADTTNKSHLYRLNSPSPPSGVYPFKAKTPSSTIPFDVINGVLDEETGTLVEQFPDRFTSFHLLYKNDGVGFTSSGSGFFLPVKQGEMGYKIAEFQNPVPNAVIDLDVDNIGSDVWVGKVNDSNDVIEAWTQLDTLQNISMGYQPDGGTKKVYEVVTRDTDKVTIKFGDGKFGAIPTGKFVVWYRTCSATPYTVRPRDIQNTSISIPYVADGNIYQLTVTFDLDEIISNAAAAETPDQIKERASAVYYTQNRMTSAEDYNQFPLSDPSILKAKAVNRTFAGHGRTLPSNDVTGSYKNTVFSGEDGRLYKTSHVDRDRYYWTPSLESASTFISSYIETGIASEEVALQYYLAYPMIELSGVTFTVTSTIGEASYGKLSTAVTSSALSRIGANSLIRFNSGVLSRINEVVANTDGTIDDSIRLKDKVEFEADGVSGYLPAIRRTFTATEESEISGYITRRQSFGLRWDAPTLTWVIVRSENIDLDGEFSIINAGDTSNTNLDASWMVHMSYVNQLEGQDQWDVTVRGASIEFESENAVEFFHSSGNKVIHPQTGRVVYDAVVLDKTNETRNSLPRRAIKTALGKDRLSGRILIEGDGSTTRFPSTIPYSASENVFVLDSASAMVANGQWSIENSNGLVQFVFTTAPSNGQFYYGVVDPRRVHLTPSRTEFVGNNTNTIFSIASDFAPIENTFVFKDTLLLSPYLDYVTYPTPVDTRARLNVAPTDDERLVVHSFAGGDACWVALNLTGDGETESFALGMKSYFVMAFINGQRTWDFTIDETLPNSDFIVFTTAPDDEDVIHVRVVFRPDVVLIEEATSTAEPGQMTINVPFVNASATRLFLYIDGVFKGDFAYDDTLDDIFLSTALAGGEEIVMTHMTLTTGMSSSYKIATSVEDVAPIETLDTEKVMKVHAPLRHADGFVNTRGLKITNIDEDNSGDMDNPFFFNEFVMTTGSSDLVLWRATVQNGYNVWMPISETSTPRGTYHSARYQRSVGDPIGSDPVGSVHYDTRTDKWLMADPITEIWYEVPAAGYRKEIGRSGLKFRWEHYADTDRTIDPSPSNIVDLFVLTRRYDEDVRTWIEEGGVGVSPQPDTGAALKRSYGELEKFKMISDSIIWHPARYKFLFGSQAEPEYRGKFLIIKAPGSTLPDSDLKLRVLSAIEMFFSASLWEFGESFYYTQLSAFIHQQLASDVHSVVVVSTNGEAFGHLFQARCEPDEIFISTASVANLEVVGTLSRDMLS